MCMGMGLHTHTHTDTVHGAKLAAGAALAMTRFSKPLPKDRNEREPMWGRAGAKSTRTMHY